MLFENLAIEEHILSALDHLGFKEPTPIQQQTIPVALAGHDVIGHAQTGTGKTAAFGIPVIQQTNPKDKHTQAIVLAPTRELAKQVASTLRSLGSKKGVNICVIYGGQSYDKQIRELKHSPHVVVGTPGRIIDHLNRGTLKIDHVQMVVLDEADEMLSMDFIEDIENILSTVPEDHQTLLFSATIPEDLTKKFMKNPVIVSIERESMTAETIEQHYILTKEGKKFSVLNRLLLTQRPERAIVFGRTKQRVMEVAQGLNARGFKAEEIHGDLNQAKRERAIMQFKREESSILVATDVAARGLDISGVTHIYNFDLPQNVDSYVHRVGRTGRAGTTGMAITLITPPEVPILKMYEKEMKLSMKQINAPSEEEIQAMHLDEIKENIIQTIDKGISPLYENAAEELASKYSADLLAAAALKLLMPNISSTQVTLTALEPLKHKKRGGKGGKKGKPHDKFRKRNDAGNYHSRHKRKRKERV